jgi:hypothetical protein
VRSITASTHPNEEPGLGRVEHVLRKVFPQEHYEVGVDRHSPSVPRGPVLERSQLAWLRILCPAATRSGGRARETDLAPVTRLLWQVGEIGPTQLGNLLASKRGVVHAREEGLQAPAALARAHRLAVRDLAFRSWRRMAAMTCDFRLEPWQLVRRG